MNMVKNQKKNFNILIEFFFELKFVCCRSCEEVVAPPPPPPAAAITGGGEGESDYQMRIFFLR